MTIETADHGTYARYQRHTLLGDPPCGPCAEAAREYRRTYLDSNPKQREKGRVYGRARYRAMRRLTLLHPADFARLLDDERLRAALDGDTDQCGDPGCDDEHGGGA